MRVGEMASGGLSGWPGSALTANWRKAAAGAASGPGPRRAGTGADAGQGRAAMAGFGFAECQASTDQGRPGQL